MKYLKRAGVVLLGLLLVLSMLSFLLPAFLVTGTGPVVQQPAPQPAVNGTITNVQTAPAPGDTTDAGFHVTQ
jgi:hypothetical protein